MEAAKEISLVKREVELLAGEKISRSTGGRRGEKSENFSTVSFGRKWREREKRNRNEAELLPRFLAPCKNLAARFHFAGAISLFQLQSNGTRVPAVPFSPTTWLK